MSLVFEESYVITVEELKSAFIRSTPVFINVLIYICSC